LSSQPYLGRNLGERHSTSGWRVAPLHSEQQSLVAERQERAQLITLAIASATYPMLREFIAATHIRPESSA